MDEYFNGVCFLFISFRRESCSLFYVDSDLCRYFGVCVKVLEI